VNEGVNIPPGANYTPAWGKTHVVKKLAYASYRNQKFYRQIQAELVTPKTNL
jgi:hypothetical protein